MIQHYIRDALNYAIFFFVAFLAIRIMFLKKKKYEVILKKELMYGFFGAYIFALLSQTVFPLWQIGFVQGEFYVQINTYGKGAVNFVPFNTIWHFLFDRDYVQDWKDVSKLNLLANVFLFVPYGILYPMISHKNSLKSTLKYGAILSFLIEIAQYFVGRSSDIDDLLLNLLGVVIGWSIYRFIWDAYRKYKSILKV